MYPVAAVPNTPARTPAVLDRPSNTPCGNNGRRKVKFTSLSLVSSLPYKQNLGFENWYSQNIEGQYLDGLSIDQTVRMHQSPIEERNK